jgi:6-phosphogluconolactonase
MHNVNLLLAKKFITLATNNISENGEFHAALSGGNTPQAFYSLLASPLYANQIAWDKVHIYLTDERFVPIAHPDSNSGMIQRLLLNHVPIPAKQIHAMKTEHTTPEAAGEEYHQLIKKHPQLDFILLGVGEDGHIASLFPDTAILTIPDKLAAAVYVPAIQAWRISLTVTTIHQAKHIALLFSGASKAKIITKALFENSQTNYPVQLLKGHKKLELFSDQTAFPAILTTGCDIKS